MDFLDIIICVIVVPILIYAIYLIIGLFHDEFKNHGFKQGLLLIIFLIVFYCLCSFVEKLGSEILDFLIGDNLIKAFILGLFVIIALIVYSIKNKKS